MNRGLEQPGAIVPIPDMEKEQATARATSLKQAATLELARAFHTDKGPGV